MGYQNQNRARWAGRKLRSVRAFKTLLEMAHASKDSDDPPVYWGGWERIAIMLGYDVPPPDAPGSTGPRKTALNAVTRAQAHLIEAGLTSVRRGPAQGHNTEVELHLDPGQRSHKVGDRTVPQSGSQRSPFKGPNGHPLRVSRGTTGTTGTRDKTSNHPGNVSTDRAHARPTADEIHGYQADEHDVACLVCQLPPGHRRHRTRTAS